MIDEDVRHPEEVDGLSVDVDELLSAQRIPVDPFVSPVHPQGRLQGQELGFLVDLHNVPEVKGNIHLKRQAQVNCRAPGAQLEYEMPRKPSLGNSAKDMLGKVLGLP